MLEAVAQAAALIESEEQWLVARAGETLAAELDSRISPVPSAAAAEILEALRLVGVQAEGTLHASQAGPTGGRDTPR